MKKYKVALLSILTFIVSYFIIILLTMLSSNSTHSSSNVVTGYAFTSYMKTIIYSILLLITSIITCTLVLLDAIKRKK